MKNLPRTLSVWAVLVSFACAQKGGADGEHSQPAPGTHPTGPGSRERHSGGGIPVTTPQYSVSRIVGLPTLIKT